MTGKKSQNNTGSLQDINPKILIQGLRFCFLVFSFTLYALQFTLICFAQEDKTGAETCPETASREGKAFDQAETSLPADKAGSEDAGVPPMAGRQDERLEPQAEQTTTLATSDSGRGPKVEPMVVNGDTFEYSTDNKIITVTGNAEVLYKGSRLTCHKLTVNMQTKDAEAEGDVRLEDKKGIVEGKKAIYNFETKTGVIMDSMFRANPYFGKADKVDKLSDAEFIGRKGYFTTCSFNRPHYRITSKKIDIFPADKVKTKHNVFYAGYIPLAYLPQYNHSLKEPFMHVQLVPGKRKDWGPYMLSAWRYSLAEDVSGRIYFDYRDKLGTAEGFGLNYKTQNFGKGDYKYYYTQERSRFFKQNQPAEFQRYFIRWRHKWDVDERTNVTSEYYKIVDSKTILCPGGNYGFLKEYFFREYEKDTQPLSYVLLHRSFDYSAIDATFQKRTNRWYTQLEKLPEVSYSLPSFKLGETPVYFTNSSQAASFNYKHAVPSPATSDIDVVRLDTSNKLSLPMKVAFFRVTPFVMQEETYYNKNVYGASSFLRSIFYSGADTSTKFYRVFDVKSDFLGLDLNGLRHVITPTVGYSYNHQPTIPASKLRQIDGTDSIARNNSASLELSNKLQTKRKGQKVDIANFRINNSYGFKPKGSRGSRLSDFLFDLELLPYSWLRMHGDATYRHSGNPADEGYKRFSNANYDLNFELGKERSFGLGQRYQRKGSNEITYNLIWRLSPKWKFSVYNRYERGHSAALKNGLREQEYFISRDLHCWALEINYNIKRGEGETIWFILRLKAFPEMGFEYNQSYHAPKPGSQSNP